MQALGIDSLAKREVSRLCASLAAQVAAFREQRLDAAYPHRWLDARYERLVVSDAHPGLKQAIREVFVGASWQRCRVHFRRNVLACVPKRAQAMVAATVRTIFAPPGRPSDAWRVGRHSFSERSMRQLFEPPIEAAA